MSRTLATASAAALAVAGVLALAACGGSGPGTSAPAATTPSLPATSAGPPATTKTPAAPTGTTGDVPATTSVEVKDGQPVGGTKTVTVKKGDHVRIVVTVDAPQEVHLHGYDIEKEATPGMPAVFDFDATFDGIYDLESHLKGTKVVKLVVEP
jgi:multidrug efflux pump subunit AcrA (membrane-fusion protein)